MNCPNCGAVVPKSYKFCAGCGAPVTPGACPNCGLTLSPDPNLCQNCGYDLKGQGQTTQKPEPAPMGITSDLKDLTYGEVVLKDTGHFPITYVKGLASSINGKLYLTSHRLVFKASKLQGVGGVYLPVAGGVFLPNPDDAKKSREYFSVLLTEITAVDSGWANLTITAGGEKFKFGGMRKTKEWAQAVSRAAGKG